MDEENKEEDEDRKRKKSKEKKRKTAITKPKRRNVDSLSSKKPNVRTEVKLE